MFFLLHLPDSHKLLIVISANEIGSKIVDERLKGAYPFKHKQLGNICLMRDEKFAAPHNRGGDLYCNCKLVAV